MVVYTPNTPRSTDTPAFSQPQMLANFQYLIPAAGTGPGLQRDHNMLLNSLTAGDGTHRQVTMAADLGAAPGFSGGVSVVYTKTANGGSQLFFQNALGEVQLTSAKASVPTIALSGCTYLPGGLLLQWGTGLIGNTITFPVAFNVATFGPIITATPTGAATPITAITTASASANTNFVAGGTGGRPYSWMAIGLA